MALTEFRIAVGQCWQVYVMGKPIAGTEVEVAGFTSDGTVRFVKPSTTGSRGAVLSMFSPNAPGHYHYRLVKDVPSPDALVLAEARQMAFSPYRDPAAVLRDVRGALGLDRNTPDPCGGEDDDERVGQPGAAWERHG